MRTVPLHHPTWRAPERRAPRPGPWLIGLGLVAMLVVEVWQTAQMTALSMDLDRTRKAFVEADAQRQFLRSDYERQTTRAELAPLASRLGLARADTRQVRALPVAYLAADEAAVREAGKPTWRVLAERASRVLVPEARARSRSGN